MGERRIHNLAPGLLLTTLLLLLITTTTLFLPSASAAAISKPLSVFQTDDKHCTDNPAWKGSGALRGDCMAAVQRLYTIDVHKYWNEDFEFLTPRMRPSSITPMQTPRKYTVGTCTLAVVMLTTFKDSELPEELEGPHASRDVTSFLELWQAATQIESVCLNSGKPGWAAEGGREAIGIFMWATDSPANRKVPQGAPMPPFLTPPFLTVENGTIWTTTNSTAS